jgi:hypothetical protein
MAVWAWVFQIRRRRRRSGGICFRRHVLYIPGYDPFPPRRYRELYRKEGGEQAAISGYELTVRGRQGEAYGWHVKCAFRSAEG